MTKAELIVAMATQMDTTQKEAKLALDSMLEVIKNTLTSGEDVKLTGFLNLEVIQKNARTGRNPATGETLEIPARKSVRAKIGKTLKDSVK